MNARISVPDSGRDVRPHPEQLALARDETDPAGRIRASQATVGESGIVADPGAVLADADRAYGRHGTVAAIAVLEEARERFPESAEIVFNLGELYRLHGAFKDSIACFKVAAGLDPEDAATRYCMGVALHEYGDIAGAIAAYRCAAELDPDDMEARNNLGAVLAEQGHLKESIEVLEAACAAAPGYMDAWLNLARGLLEDGRRDEALERLKRAMHFNAENPRLLFEIAVVLRDAGRLGEARTVLAHARRLAPHDARIGSLLCEVLEAGEQYAAACGFYEHLMSMDPANFPEGLQYARLLGRAGRVETAFRVFDRLGDSSQDPAQLVAARSDLSIREGRVAAALDLLRPAVARWPDNPALRFNLGIAEQFLGNFRAAAESHRQALRLDPGFGRAALNLVMNRDVTPEEDELSHFQQMAQDVRHDNDQRLNFEFALGQVHHRLGDHDRAFGHFQRGNELRLQRLPFDAQRFAARIDRLKKAAAGLAARPLAEESDITPIFIVGMPRSGSTLVEGMLGRHENVAALGESPILPRLLQRFGIDSADADGLDDDTCRRLAFAWRQQVLECVGTRTEPIRFVTDKLLGNFLRLPLIYRIFPHARVVHSMRHPVATCLSCYFQNFDHGLRFTSDLGHLVLFYREYRSLMAYFEDAVPGMARLDMHYEDLVAHPDPERGRLLRFLGLSTIGEASSEPAGRIWNTASFWQARQHVYQSSTDYWRDYRHHIGPLLKLLDDFPEYHSCMTPESS